MDIRTLLIQAVRDSAPRNASLTEEVEVLLTRGRLTQSDAILPMLQAVDETTFELAKATPMSNVEAERIGDVYKAVQPEWFDNLAALVNWRGYMALVSSNTIHEVLHGRVPYYTPDMASGFRLGHDEHPIVRRKTGLAEYRSVATGSNYQSISLPVGGGMYYRLGSSHQSTRQTGLVLTDRGEMLITTHAIYFGGELHTFRIPFTSILRTQSFVDGFGVHENHGTGKVFIPYLIGKEEEGWFFYNVVSALLTWQCSQA